MNRAVVFVALAALEAGCIWFFGWQLYTALGLNTEFTTKNFQLILIGLMVFAGMIDVAGYYFTEPKQKQKDNDEPEEEKPDIEELKNTYQILKTTENKKDIETFTKKHEEILDEIIPEEPKITKEQERINTINRKIKEVAKEQAPVNDPSSGMEPEWTEPFHEEIIYKTKDTTPLKEVLEKNKVRVHNAIVDNLIKQLESGEIKVEPSQETIRRLGLSDITLKTIKKPEPNTPVEPDIDPPEKKPKYPQEFKPIPLTPSDMELEMEKPLLSRRRN